MTHRPTEIVDILVIGGGVNGCGIARDAVGRGLNVMLVEQGDLASGTSSASTKLFHGGLRYLEFFEIALVREALSEREVLLKAMPHISWPMRFVLPLHSEMRFSTQTPVSKLLKWVMPWLRGRRPDWLIRLGLFLYDHLGGRKILPATTRIDLRRDIAGNALQPHYIKAFEYSDCWVDDARLVALNARDAAERGAHILTRTRLIAAEPVDGQWQVTLEDMETGVRIRQQARCLVNAAGPWAGEVADSLGQQDNSAVRLVRGSHIVTRRLFDHDKCYFFQGDDGRIIFAIPYEDDFTLIGTTDVDHPDPDIPPECSAEESIYLMRFASQYFRQPITPEDIVWRYSGVRPLFDDGTGSATAATREYTLHLERVDRAPVLNVFGGKITTYRRLSEHAVEKIAPLFDLPTTGWSAGVPLPGGDFPVSGVEQLITQLCAAYPWLGQTYARRLLRSYGTDAFDMLGAAQSPQDLGRDFGASLSEAEVRWLMRHEFARCAEDVLWRRGKLGLRLGPAEVAALDGWMQVERERAKGGEG